MPALKIETHAVESSNLEAIGYDAASRTLAVEFKSGHVHHYADVPAEIAMELVRAESKGRFYAASIRGKFTSEKMTATCSACGDIGYVGEKCTDCGTRNYGTALDCGCDPGVNYVCAEHGGTSHYMGAR